jgi:fibronectin-binding autotransporter adhesin
LYNDSTSTLTINSAGVGDDLDITGGVPQGFLVASGGSVIINSAIVGNGGVAPELTGSLSLFGVNTYSGGTALGDSGNTLTYFNNSSSFGSGGITLNRTGIGNFSTLLSSGGSPITLANNFSTVLASTGSGTGLNFANGANTPVLSTGSWTLGTVGLALRNNGNSTAPLTLSGAISGSSSLIFSGANGGTTYITGSSAGNSGFTGTATIGGGAGENAITVSLGALNTLSSITGMTLAGGTLSAGGFNQAMSGAALAMTASSVLNFGATANTAISFTGGSGTWTGVLNLGDWQGNPVADGGTSSDTLEFGTSAGGLTSAQLADIEFDGNAATLGSAALDANGFVVEVPEPSTIALGVMGGLSVFWNIRRRRA